MRTAVAAIRSIAAYVGVSLYVAITAPVGMALALIFRWKAILLLVLCSAVLGTGSSIGIHSALLGYTIEDGFLHLGTIRIGQDCFVGASASLRPRLGPFTRCWQCRGNSTTG